MTLEKYIQWLKAHEKLIIVVIGAWLALHFYGDVLNYKTNKDKQQIAAQVQVAQIAAQKSQADSQANQQLLQQLADMKLQYVTLSAQVTASVQQRNQNTTEQKQRDNQASLPEVATRIMAITRVQPQEISATDTGITLSTAAAHADVNALEDGIAAAANILDLNKQLSACTAINQKQDETITGVRKELADEKQSHQQDIKLEQANTKLAVDEGKKQFRRGFKYGVIVGVIGSSAVTVYLKIAKII